LLPNSPFKDVRVRQALNYAIDRKTIAAEILHDLVPPASQVVARVNPDYDPTIAPYAYDPKKAKVLLTEAGFADGLDFTYEMNNAGGPDMAAVMEQVAHDLAQVNVHMDIRPEPWPQIVQKVRQGGWRAEAFGLEYEVLPTGDTLWPFRLHSCAWTHPWYCDDAAMPLVAEAKTLFDGPQRRTVIHELLARTQQQAPTVVLFEPVGLDALNPKVANYTQIFGTISYSQIVIRP
jgi:peptide/nickel transport system substrate-binding protein